MRLEDDAVADAAIFPDGRVRVGEKIIADGSAFVNDNVRVQDRILLVEPANRIVIGEIPN